MQYRLSFSDLEYNVKASHCFPTPVCGTPNAFLLGQTFKTLNKMQYCVSKSSSAPIKWEIIKGLCDSQQAQTGVTGKAKQQICSPSKKQTGQQEVADLAALRQQKATSAAKQARGISGPQRAVALRGLDALPQPFADAAKTIMVTACTILNSFVTTQPTHAKYVQSLVLQCCVSEAL